MQKIEIPSILNATSFKGIAESESNLPLYGNICGDFFVVENPNSNEFPQYISYMWDGYDWLKIAPSLNNLVDPLSDMSTTSCFEYNLKKLEEKTRELQLKEQKLCIVNGC